MSIPCPACQKPYAGDLNHDVITCASCGKKFDPQQKNTIIEDTDKTQTQWRSKQGAYCGPYQLVSAVGRGGMSEVWSAQRENDSQDYVVKILLAHLVTNENIIKRFDREIDSLTRLRHQHIVPVIDHGEIDGRPYLVSNILAQHSLRTQMNAASARPIDHHTLQQLSTQCLSALSHAHQHDIVHRDMKPENILVLNNGEYAITDFGIAQVSTDDNGKTLTLLTDTNMVLGTFSYMAPEQSRGSRNIDARADLYSLGVVLYEYISGHLPEGRFEDPAQFLSRFSKQQRAQWNTIILRLLERDPDKRYAAAQAVLDSMKNKITIEYDTHSVSTQSQQKLYRQIKGRWITGLCAGLSTRTHIHTAWYRLLFIISTMGIPLASLTLDSGTGLVALVANVLLVTGFYTLISLLIPVYSNKDRLSILSNKLTEKTVRTLNRNNEINNFSLLAPVICLLILYAVGLYEQSQLSLLFYSCIAATIILLTQLHRKRPMRALSFNGFACGLALCACCIILLNASIVLYFNPSIRSDIFFLTKSGNIGFFETDVSILGFGILFLSLLWTMFSGRYAALSIIIGFIPAEIALLTLHVLKPATKFFTQDLLHLFATLIVWIICSLISHLLLSWILKEDNEQTHKYSIFGSIITASLIMCIIIALLF